VPLVVDPVMVAKGGHRLLEAAAEDTVRRRLLPRAALITPNLPEAEVLSGRTIAGEADMARAAEALARMGARAVLMKGGHLDGARVVDLLWRDGRIERFESARIETRHTHGTGCTLASAIATGLAQGLELAAAVRRARDYVHRAIVGAPGFGAGHGPLDHSHTVRVPR
jgi:hydroxymethylpyrimidine/phosphomethylpyrimidine kinase